MSWPGVSYFLLTKETDAGTPFDNIQWAAVLKSASALEMYRREHGRIETRKVADFLILDRQFPRSMRFGVVTAHYFLLVGGLVIGGIIGLTLARRVQMTQMPELVAILHSLVGLAAVLVGFANFMDPEAFFEGVEKTIHDIEVYLGILIGAVTFSG